MKREHSRRYDPTKPSSFFTARWHRHAKREVLLALSVSLGVCLFACDDGDESDGVASTEDSGDAGPTSAASATSSTSEMGPDEGPQGAGGLFGGNPVVAVEETDEGVLEPQPEADPQGGPTEEDPVVACAGAVAEGDDPRIDDFDDLDLLSLEEDNRGGSWYAYDDGTPDALVSLSTATDDSTAGVGEGVLEVSGDAFDQYSGIGVVLRWTDTGDENCFYDASYYEGVTFWARGRGLVRVAFQNPSVRAVESGGSCPDSAGCFDAHGTDIRLDDDWTEYRIAFTSLEQEGWGLDVGPFLPEELFVIEYQFRAGSSYELWLDDLAFYGAPSAAPDGGATEAGATPHPTESADAGAPEVTEAGTEPPPDGGHPAQSTPDASVSNADGGDAG